MSNGTSGHLPSEQEAGKFVIHSTETVIDHGSPLPEVYHENRLVIMPRDPFWFVVYWEITPDRLEGVRHHYGPSVLEKAETILRVYDLTGLTGDDYASRPSFDVRINFDDRRWYVQVPQSGKTWG